MRACAVALILLLLGLSLLLGKRNEAAAAWVTMQRTPGDRQLCYLMNNYSSCLRYILTTTIFMIGLWLIENNTKKYISPKN